MSNLQLWEMETRELLARNILDILPSKKEFEERLQKGPIKIYLGIDPSSPEIHLGHAVALWKLREFQEAGHKVILLIGDFTGMIGDPSGREATRKKLTKEEVLENAKTYKEQVSKIIRFDGENPAEMKFNSEWLGKLSAGDLLELASHLTHQQLIERDMFQQRIKEGKELRIHELLYPILQGYDSLAMEIDAEIGGSDQTFNMLIGRTFLGRLKSKEKFVISVPLLEGLDGRKMSKSYGNFIGITDDPPDMFGKVMSLKDELVLRYFELTTNLPLAEIQSIEEGLQSNELHPMEAKKRLAWEIVRLYRGEEEADKARQSFEEVFQKGAAPREVPVYETKKDSVDLTTALVEKGLAKSKSEARRLIDQGAIDASGEKITSSLLDLSGKDRLDLRVGKYRFLQIKRI